MLEGAASRVAIETKSAATPDHRHLKEPADVTRDEYCMNTNRNMSDNRRRSRRIAIRRCFNPNLGAHSSGDAASAEPVVKVIWSSCFSQEPPTPPGLTPDDTESHDARLSEHAGPIRRLSWNCRPRMVTTAMHQRSDFGNELEATHGTIRMRAIQF